MPKILLVEDDALIAMELAQRVRDLAYDVLGPAHSIAEAEALLAHETPEGALLDVSLAQGASSVSLGVKLHAQGVRVAFCTGYDHLKGMPPELVTAPVLTKPLSDAVLEAELRKLVS